MLVLRSVTIAGMAILTMVESRRAMNMPNATTTKMNHLRGFPRSNSSTPAPPAAIDGPAADAPGLILPPYSAVLLGEIHHGLDVLDLHVLGLARRAHYKAPVGTDAIDEVLAVGAHVVGSADGQKRDRHVARDASFATKDRLGPAHVHVVEPVADLARRNVGHGLQPRVRAALHQHEGIEPLRRPERREAAATWASRNACTGRGT